MADVFHDQLSPIPDCEFGPQIGSWLPRKVVFDPSGGIFVADYGSASLNTAKRTVDHHLFPQMFLISCILLFATPIFLCCEVGMDQDASYWLGRRVLLSFLLVPCYTIVYAIHTYFTKPGKNAIMFSLIGSCIVLLYLSDTTLTDSYEVVNTLTSPECHSGKKAEIDGQWVNASTFFSECTARLAARDGTSQKVAAQRYRMAECAGFDSFADEWAYLAHVEEYFQCAGWCSSGAQLWSRQKASNSCSQAVGRYIQDSVQWRLMQVTCYSAVALGMLTLLMIFVAPTIW
uniref:Uncharacterized protein n=1 Tax=Noctiluca scintillans TaxID=2966 RepID=A0A7S1A330_NOCSC